MTIVELTMAERGKNKLNGKGLWFNINPGSNGGGCTCQKGAVLIKRGIKSDFGLKRGREVKKSNFSFKKGGERAENNVSLWGGRRRAGG